MRRQRTASENGEANASETDSQDPQRIRESSDHSDQERIIIDSTSGDDMESIEHDSNNNSDNHDTDIDDDTDGHEMDYDTDYDSFDDDEDDDDDEEEASNNLDIMNQLQSALFGISSATITQSDLERLRHQIASAGGLFSSGSSTHSTQIRSIIRSLPQQDSASVDPMQLYSTFIELWEMIVLTGEEVESYEFDTVVDLKPLLPHLLRVLRWEADCQTYGSEFLLYAVRCTRACVQYSPSCARRLVETGLVPLITRQLFSVEYIDLAEDLIQIIQILTKSGTHSKACLHSDGIRAVLGFVDFFALPVQVNAFTAAAQMTSALTNDTLHLYLPSETAALLRATVRRYTETDSHVFKLVHQATLAISNAIQAAPVHVDELCPSDFVNETVLPLASVHPLDSSSLLLKLVSISKLTPTQLATSNEIINYFKALLRTAATNENLLETTLKLVIDLFCQSAPNPLQDLIGLCLRNKTLTEISELKELKNDAISGLISENLFEFYLNSPSISLSSRHSTLCTLLLLDSSQTAPVINLVKMGALSRLLTTATSDPLILIIGLEWCRVLSQQRELFVSTVLRQGLPSELKTLLSSKPLSLPKESSSLKKWLAIRLESVNKTVYSGEESESLQIYINTFTNNLILLTENIEAKDTQDKNIGSVKDLLELMKNEKFTEYEWLGDSETCLARQLYNLLNNNNDNNLTLDTSEYKPICEAIYKALNRYDSFFTLTLPLAKLTRATSSNPLEALAILARPLRVHLTDTTITGDAREKIIVCDPFASVAWIVKMGGCRDEEREIILRETTGTSDVADNLSNGQRERVYDAIDYTPSNGYGIVDISSTSFTTQSLQVHLHHSITKEKFLIPPAASLIEVLFEHVVTGTGANKWNKINDIWNGGPIKLFITKRNDDATDLNDNYKLLDLSTNKRVKLALDLLKLLPFKSSDDHLTSKLSKELDSPLLIAVNGISPHWIQTAQSYHFLYPFALRLNLMKSVCVGRLRALWILQQRTNNSVELNSVVSVPRKKFRIHRDQFLRCFKNVFTAENCGDLRLFEFEYSEELGTGHGPTMEFYALASQAVRDSFTSVDGLFPSWKGDLDKDWYRIIGALIARAWLDDRIIDIPINPLFLKSLINPSEILKFDHLQLVDQELYNSLKSSDNLIGSELTFHIPGTEISLCQDNKEIKTIEDAEHFKALLMDKISVCMIEGRESFLQGFNQSFPCSFQECIKYFTASEVSRLFSFSLSDSSSTPWTPALILSALIPDHGYTPSSPQIQWLAELIAETEGSEDRIRLIRFLTGAAYLPVGGWKALRPMLTIVCKSDDTTTAVSSASSSNSTPNISSINIPVTSPTPSTTSDIHDSYLPSVMTCANYLKLPRYSSKSIMKERFEYALKEGCNSFHLS